MSKIIKVSSKDIANIVKQVIQETSEDKHDNLIAPVFMSLTVDGRDFNLMVQYSVAQDNDDGSLGIPVGYSSYKNEVYIDPDFNEFVAEELLDLVKHDFINRFKIHEQYGLGKDITLHGNVTFDNNGYMDWNPDRV